MNSQTRLGTTAATLTAIHNHFFLTPTTGLLRGAKTCALTQYPLRQVFEMFWEPTARPNRAPRLGWAAPIR